ncbi:hypothetical protein PV379_00885 [Streptomyces caniscabiei]|uniref:hypothetical protein n=1 Tax=Streptomyces caniscabiei TaxID=2746961 RepID=UPI0029B2B374|nr:hypothetical protein [Streptomyces caniscabiei]MDX2775910.1 hypothetical protein [Streptomyces caniscabiei]
MTTVVDVDSSLRNAEARVSLYARIEQAVRLDEKAFRLFTEKNWGDLLDRLRALHAQEQRRLRELIASDDLEQVNSLIEEVREQLAQADGDTSDLVLLNEEVEELTGELAFISNETKTLSTLASAILALELFEVPARSVGKTS